MYTVNNISLTENELNLLEMPGFGPAAEILFFREKDPKPLTPHPASSEKANAGYGRADQLAELRQGPPVHESVRLWGRMAGVGQRRGATQTSRLWKLFGITITLCSIQRMARGDCRLSVDSHGGNPWKSTLTDSGFKVLGHGFESGEEVWVLMVFGDSTDEGAADDDAICKLGDIMGLLGGCDAKPYGD